MRSVTFIFIFSLLLWVKASFAQSVEAEGIVFDSDTKFRLTRVSITNLTTGASIFNNSKGEFKLSLSAGDKITASLFGYKPDTLIFNPSRPTLIFNLKRLAIPLAEVLVQDSVLSAKKRFEELRKQFSSLNRLGNNRDILTIGNQGGAGLSIDALWSALSREGKNARRLQEIMERDYINNFIDERFTKALVTKTTGLRGGKLEIFMLNYRPSYFFVLGASEYDLISYIKIAYIRFKRYPYQEDLSHLQPIKLE
ncbi:hypothetical protein [Pedobacter puniceum]|jgi:hypothetical protein|uniref:Carboxypeptidase-like regulatory domain-containing protein n=1 Tax=Pedobacter puniceum TaxID=2666136 RepID=A0A7K0FNC1_9SPHI|nr:hypothetical protein [Pedobacter puniceum]MRX47484.1 hypothetical protein [Pedobacter puniceum]